MRYVVVIEKGERNYSAYVPDLPGCVSVGDTAEQVKSEIREAIEFHLEGKECGTMDCESRSRRVRRST
jgi:predicted RNase H-like HicB family nuclease